jgi:hypothetical protein
LAVWTAAAGKLERYNHHIAWHNAGCLSCLRDNPNRFMPDSKRAGKCSAPGSFAGHNAKIKITARDRNWSDKRISCRGKMRALYIMPLQQARFDISELTHSVSPALPREKEFPEQEFTTEERLPVGLLLARPYRTQRTICPSDW